MNTRDVLTAAEVRERYGIDIITAEVIKNALIQITRHMHLTLQKGSYSPAIRDYMDIANAVHLITDEGLEMAAVTEGCTQHAFNQQFTCNVLLAEYGLENLRPGDVIVTNDPFRGGIHLPDPVLLKVVFWEGKPVMAVSDVAHWADIGGATPGSYANGWATDHCQEGIRIPPMLFWAEGKPVRSALNLMVENTRIPGFAVGDLRAQYGAVTIGEELVLNLIRKYGVEAVRAGARYAIDYNERLMRAAIRAVPDGDYYAEDYLDDDGIELEPVKICATVRVRGDSMQVDMSGTQRQPLGNNSSGWGAEAVRVVLISKMMLEPTSVVNAGTFKPIEIISPPGSAVHALPPTSTNNHQEVGSKMCSVLFQALSQAIPERGVAPDYGTNNQLTLGGYDPRPGRNMRPWVHFELPAGGWGGTWKEDGVPYCLVPYGNCYDPVIEFSERDAPVVVLTREFVIDSGGPGKFRGGPACYGTLLAQADFTMSMGCDRARTPAPGINGGGPGMNNLAVLYTEDAGLFPPTRDGVTPARYLRGLYGRFDAQGRPDPAAPYCVGTVKQSNKFSFFPMKAGTVVRNYSGGGGGWGDPLERDPARVLADVRNELVSPPFARLAYGVVLTPDGNAVDEEATRALRAELRARRERGEWSLPPTIYPDWPIESLAERPLAEVR